MSRKMNRMLRHALEFDSHSLYIVAAGLFSSSYCAFPDIFDLLYAKNPGAGSSITGILSAPGNAWFISLEIISHRALIILFLYHQDHRAIRLRLLGHDPILHIAAVQPLFICRHFLLHQPPGQPGFRILLQQKMQCLADACSLYPFHIPFPFQKNRQRSRTFPSVPLPIFYHVFCEYRKGQLSQKFLCLYLWKMPTVLKPATQVSQY